MVLSLPLLVAGSLGFYISILSCKNAVNRLIIAVLIPSLTSILTILCVAFFWFRHPGEPGEIALSPAANSSFAWLRLLISLAANLGPGLQFAILGIVLVAIFWVLLQWGRVSLPIRIRSSPLSEATPSESDHRNVMLFVWRMVGLVPLAYLFQGLVTSGVFLFWPRSAHPNTSWVFILDQSASTVLLLVLVLFALGKSGRKTVPEMVRLPSVGYFGLAALIPAAISCGPAFLGYLEARIQWSTHEWGRAFTPSLESFLGLPHLISAWYLAHALVEEIAWRGYLQPRFIRRYGLYRGIFLVGIVWGAFHFSSDFHPYMSSVQVLAQFASRLSTSVALSLVLAWLTLASKSILPAAVAHAVYNICVLDLSLIARAPWWAAVLLWLAVSYLLFHFFPRPTGVENFTPRTESIPEPAPK